MIRGRHLVSVAAAAAATAALALTTAGTAHAQLVELKWATEGYFRTRTVTLTNLAPQPRRTSVYPPNGETIVIPDIRRTSYIVSRFRMMPSLSYGKVARLNLQIDALDDVLWGDNNGLSTAPLFATDGSNQGFLGGPVGDSVTIRRAWVQFSVPVGVMRVGRMPSHWGMGLLANGGGTGWLDPETPKGEPQRKMLDNFFDDDFGDNHFGSTADRILFITKPITIYRTVKKLGKVDHPLVVGYAFDKLSESPLLPFENFERKFRPFGQQGFISRGRNDDVNEHVALVVWNDPDWDKKSFLDELRVGLYGVLRTAREGSTQPSAITDPTAICGTFDGVPYTCEDTGSKVWIADLWWRVRYGNLFTEGEVYQIGGQTFGGVPFPSRNQKKEASIRAGAARFAWLTQKWDAMLEIGHASGDDVLEDEHFKQRAMHPDFNVGLILFEETLRELTARTYGIPFFSNENPQGALGLMSNGGVINANYVFPKFRFRPTPVAGLEVIGGILAAWVDTTQTDGTALFPACSIGGACTSDGKDSTYLGTEVDLAVRASFAGNMRFALETGYLRFGGALKHQLTEASGSFTLQTSLAFVW
ncbi:MAG: hypothetical protein HS111_06640 [Kofleriaceae bacterium]|nr:hypothetical protein [Kofleriaceae bacterium]MCL4223822.1 hypothetical protein [Myxococcales bacterium]